VNSTTNLIYVANSEGNSVSVIDGSTNAVTATVGGMSAPYFLGVNSTTNQVFVANSNGNNVTVIDGATNTIVTTVPVGRDPIGIRVKSISNLVYVANFVDGTISEIDGATDLVTNTFVLPPSRPEFIALDPMTNHLFVTDAMNEVVDVLDASSGALLNTITGGRVPFKALAYVVMFRPGKSILISDYSLNAVTEVNENTYAATAGLKGGIRPLGIAVNRKTGKIYVAEQGEDTVNVYNK
jgi:YVTN family beta-propeller protein